MSSTAWLCMLLVVLYFGAGEATIDKYSGLVIPSSGYWSRKFPVSSHLDGLIGTGVASVTVNFETAWQYVLLVDSDGKAGAIAPPGFMGFGTLYVMVYSSRYDPIVAYDLEYMRTRDRCPDLPNAQFPAEALNNATDFVLLQFPYGNYTRTSHLSWSLDKLYELASFEFTLELPYSGTWSVLMFNCENRQSVFPDSTLWNVHVYGNVTWQNSFGYAPTSSYLPMYFIQYALIGLYLFCGVVYMIISARFRTDLHFFQRAFAMLFYLGVLSSALTVGEIKHLNISGSVSPGLLTWATIATTIHHTVTRIVFLLLAMGYKVTERGVSRSQRIFLPAVGVLYFLTSISYGLVQIQPTLRGSPGRLVGFINEPEDIGQLVNALLILPVAIVEVVYVFWLLICIDSTLASLRNHSYFLRNQGREAHDVKILLFVRLKSIATIAIIFVTFVFLIKFFVYSFQLQTAIGSFWWAFDAFQYLLYFCVLAVVAYGAMRPSRNNAHFRPPNQEELQEDEDGYGNNVERQQIRIETIGAAEDMDDLPDY